MKIAIYTHNLQDLGGIERVVREHLRIFPAKGAECLVFGEAGCEHVVPLSGVQRRAAVEALLREFKPDYCILHGVSHPGANDDIAVCKARGIPVITVCHFSFPSAMLMSGDENANRTFLAGARQCDMVATVSSIDSYWWRSLGCRAMYCQNPFVHPRRASATEVEVESGGGQGTVNLIWVGRTAEQKQPDMAIRVMAEVVKTCPNVHMTMIGGSDAGWVSYRKMVRQMGLVGKIDCLAQRDDLGTLWAQADIHLLTSLTECSPLVVAEAKANQLPTVMFAIPFLDVNKGGKGFLSAPQGDVGALANCVVQLVNDPELCVKMGEEAKASLSVFNDDAVWQTWLDIFEALKTGKGGYEVDPIVKTIVEQQTIAWDRYCEKHLPIIQKVYLWRRAVNKLKRILKLA